MSTPLRTLVTAAALALTASFGLAAPAAAAPAPPKPTTGTGQTGATLPTPLPGVGAAASPEARCTYDFQAPGVNIRSLPNTGSNIRGQGNPGDCLVYHQAMTSQYVDCPEFGYGTDQWFDVTDLRTGARGWVLGCYVAVS